MWYTTGYLAGGRGVACCGGLASAEWEGCSRRHTWPMGRADATRGGCDRVDRRLDAAGMNGSRTSSTRQVGAGTTAITTYCTDSASRLTSVSSTPTGLSILPAAITYDGHGNATQIGTQAWTYDGADRVTSATANGITPSSAVYVRDSLGRVIVSGPVAAPVRYGFTGADDSPDFQLTTAGGLGERYVSLPGGALLTVNGTTMTWSIPNLHGDIIATVTGTTVTAGFLYDPYGQPLDSSSLAVNIGAVPATRTGTTSDAWHGSAQRGYEHGGGLNQILMGARSYLPELGIFTATDPIEGGNTTTYAYPQDPINHNNLTGQWGEWITQAVNWTIEHRDGIIQTAGYIAVGACVFATAGVCGGIALAVGAVSAANRLATYGFSSGKKDLSGWLRVGAAAALDIGLSRLPGVRRAVTGLYSPLKRSAGRSILGYRGAHRIPAARVDYMSLRRAVKGWGGSARLGGASAGAYWTYRGDL